ncbi:VOC family protein [Nocardia sp. NPDC049526]|uniref:VOC family protein n=1 Tax=Nocardia sp. NPDC049526 TaxID=3364316 RepID=UPI0037AD8E49
MFCIVSAGTDMLHTRPDTERKPPPSKLPRQALGATVPEHQPAGARARVVIDPAGHPFCLTLD